MAHRGPFSAKLPGRGGAHHQLREATTMGKSSPEGDFESRVVEFAMASWDMQRTQSYVERGRQFEGLTSEDLEALFVQTFRIWRPDLWGEGRSRVGDLSAEYTLRGVDPPFLLVDDDILAIGAAVAEDVERMGPESLAEMNSGLLDAYLAAQKSRN